MSGRPRVRSWIVLRSLVAEAAANLRSRRLQAVLSAFGIATGIAAVVLLVALVSGLHRMALRTFNAAGGSLVEVFVQADESTRDPGGFPLTLGLEDVGTLMASSRYFDLAAASNMASAVVRGQVVQSRSVFMSEGALEPVIRTMTRARRVVTRGLTGAGFEILDLEHAARGASASG